MLRILLGRDWTANRDEILRRIGRDVRNREENRILLVPELISHEMERRLCLAAGDTASRYAEVLSFTRLTGRVSDSTGCVPLECMDDGGRIVTMAAAARQLSSQLKAYAALETKPEFLTGLVEAVDEFKRCCISSRDLTEASQKAEGSFAQKLEELALLMESYDALCSQGKRDPRDQMTWVLEQLEYGSFAEEHIFYIDGFPDFTRQNLAIISHIIEHSPDVTITVNCDQIQSTLLAFEKAGNTAHELFQTARDNGVVIEIEYVPVNISPLTNIREKLFQGNIVFGQSERYLNVSRCGSPFDECLYAAQQIRNRIFQGDRYRDITVVCTDMTQYQPLINYVFHRFNIPLYQAGTEQILQKSVIATVLCALDAVQSGFEQKAVFRYLRSSLSPIDPDSCDILENYAVVWGVRGSKWMKCWQNHPDGLSGIWDTDAELRLRELEIVRFKVMEPLRQLQEGFREAKNLCALVSALYQFLENIHMEDRLTKLAIEMDESGDNRSAQILNQLWEILLSAMEQLYDSLGETYWESEHFLRLFKLLLSQYEVGTIPPVLDAVQIGSVSAMRCHQQKHLIVLGADEGKLPGYTGSTGILTDQERVSLRALGVSLTGGATEGIQAEFAEIYGVFCGATESVSVSCSGEQPSFIYRRLAELAGSDMVYKDEAAFATADDWEAAAFLCSHNDRDAAKSLGLEESYEEASIIRDYSLGKISAAQVHRLYGDTLRLSASQIDRQAECRLSYFLKYGIQARERKEAEVDPAEFGTYVHAVLENTARCVMEMGGFDKVSLEKTMEIAHRFSQEYAKERFLQLESDRMIYLFQRNIRELDMVVRELWEELSRSQFCPKGFEVSFGRGEELPPIAIPNRAINAILTGYVDRVDVWNNGLTDYYRIVDYKTGKKSFDYCDVYNGIGLQLLLYMFALRNTGTNLLGERPIAAGVQYFPARAPYLPADGRLNEEEAENLRKSQWIRSGLLLQDEAVLRAMEPGEKPRRMDYTVKKDGTVTGNLADREQMKMLELHVFHVLASLVEDIASGNVQPNPYTRGTSHNACSYCPYTSVCHAETVDGRRNYQKMSAERFWEDIETEVHKYGG